MALTQNIRFAVRTLLKSPGFAVAAVGALAIGIGANTAIFSVANAFLLKPIALPNLDRLMMIIQTVPRDDNDWTGIAPADYRDWKNNTTSFEATAAYRSSDMNLADPQRPDVIHVALVASGFFSLVRVQPQLGRVLLADSRRLGNDREVVLGFDLWTGRFAGDKGIVGKTIRLDSKNYVVAGVLPKGFEFPLAAEAWAPLPMGPADMAVRTSRSLRILALRKVGVAPATADSEIRAKGDLLARDFPEMHRGRHLLAVPLRQYLTGNYTRQYTFLLMAAVLLVLLIACANVANLQFARAVRRQKEMALRGALGATRWQILKQLLTESVLLALAGGILGVLLGSWGIALIRANMPAEVARQLAGWESIQLDPDVLLFTLLLSAIAGIVAGLAPAIRSANADAADALKEGGRGSSLGLGRDRVRMALLTGEISLSVILLIGAGLMVRGTRSFSTIGDEMDPASILTARFSFSEFKDMDARKSAGQYQQVLIEVQSIPGVRAACLTTALPFYDTGADVPFSIEGRPALQLSDVATAPLHTVSASYFEMMKMAVRKGRRFDDHDTGSSMPVAVVSRQMAQRYWPNASPVGSRIRLGSDPLPLTIVGVVGDVRYDLYEREPASIIYVPYTQRPAAYSYLALRASGDPTSLTPLIRRRIAAILPDQPLSHVQTLATVRADNGLGLAYVAVMLTILGGIAFALACVGVYGVMAYAVAQRTREIGIRMSLGAKRLDVLRMVMRQGMLVTATGLAIGLAASIALASAMAKLIYGVEALDLPVFAGVPTALALVALLACLIPARRALGIEPISALRSD